MRWHPLLFLAQIVLAISICPFCEAGALAQSHESNDPTSGRIISIVPTEPKGKLKVRQGKGLGPIDATPNMLVRRGYVLILDPAARAKVLCGDGKEREIAPGWHGCPCTAPCTREVCGMNYDRNTLALTRGSDTSAGLFPVVISPRKTLLLGTRPDIRWAPIVGAKESTIYKVTLYGDNIRAWTREVAATRLGYPDNEPALMPGQTYKVEVTAEGLSSSLDRSPGLGFTVLTADRARALADEELKRRKLGLSEAQTNFLVSNLYAARELYSEAIEQLEAQYTSAKDPAVAKLLGDSYAVIGLSREAETKYLEALDLTPADDLEGRGLIQNGLAQVYENLGIPNQAIARLEEAIKVYRRLRNPGMVKVLLNEAQRLKEPRGKR